ncbi:beta-glucosidase [Aeromicrobium panaciterrae]|uniref:Beta-glucosidase n=1 Tax=Aeromicrobium panaciterrae TaxID=363861 RepID=A0ABU1UJQ9_9ACTN|nr:glycoside hydrolase family 3 C-terminal domain-containing protein [Aeromicrobium panaciterrae]MDR7085408.1 beta-glucosidase [Aeromicrobium panaciterrae]
MRATLENRGGRRLGVLVAALAMAGSALALSPAAAETTTDACSWMDASKTPKVRAQELVAAMTLDDKIQMVTGIGILNPKAPNKGASGVIVGNPRLCLPDLVLNDSSGGIGFNQKGTTAFPQGVTQSSTWNADLIKAYGKVLANEAVAKGVNVILGPGMNMSRNPLAGRNLEYAGEDPHLTTQMGVGLIKGIQSKPGVMADAKHFVLNEQETDRMINSSEVDERTLREMYLPPFVAAVKAGVGSFMCSYNRVDSVYACENKALLTDLLKKEMGFDGFVMSDWGAHFTTADAANAGLDMEMAGDGYAGISQAQPAKWGPKLKAAVEDGSVPQARVDDMIRRIATPMFRLGLFEHPPVTGDAAAKAVATTPQSLAMAKKIAEEGSVLLKNSGKILPLKSSAKKIAVIGLPASTLGAQLSSQGFGSNHVPVFGLHPDVSDPLAALKKRAAVNGTKVSYDTGTVPPLAGLAAKDADAAIVFVGNAEIEGQDRTDLTPRQAYCNPFLEVLQGLVSRCFGIPGDQDALVKAVVEANPNTIVVLQNGGPLAMPWLDSVKAVVENWYPGQVDGDAITSLLFGDSNFSGKLPITFPKQVGDGPLRTPEQFPGVTGTDGIPRSTYSEKLLIGYRWYQAKNIKPLFPFGYGKSYTSFAFSGLKVTPKAGGAATVSVKVTNTGSRSGAEVAQAYVAFPKAAGEPPLQLKAFKKIFLKPGKSASITLTLDRSAFSIWKSGWTVTRGCYKVRVGSSSADLPLAKSIARGGGTC